MMNGLADQIRKAGGKVRPKTWWRKDLDGHC
jgi:hypothetical protein